MKCKIAICDDSQADRNYIQDLTGRWLNQRRIDASISPFSSAENFLFQYQEEKDFDILLLDIEMGDMDGVSLAKKLRKDNEAMQIVFVTGYSDYIAEGYEVEALHYLMKPVKEEKLMEVLDRAIEKLAKNEKILTLEAGGEMVRIPVYQIAYLDVQGNYVTIHAKQDYTIKRTLSQVAAELDDRFYKVGRSAVVNLTYISRVTKTDIYLKDGSQIPLPRGAYEGVNRAIISMN